MITTTVPLSHFEKTLITDTGAIRSSDWAIFDRCFGGDKAINENKFLLCFIGLSNVEKSFFKTNRGHF